MESGLLYAQLIMFKRDVVGSFHKVSRRHLERYLEEFELRLNNRKNPFICKDSLIELLGANPLRYRELVTGEPA